MKWKGRRRSSNVDDRRGKSTGTKLAAGGGVIAVIFFIIQLFGGSEVNQILDQLPQQGPATEERELTAEEKELGAFTEVLLADT